MSANLRRGGDSTEREREKWKIRNTKAVSTIYGRLTKIISNEKDEPSMVAIPRRYLIGTMVLDGRRGESEKSEGRENDSSRSYLFDRVECLGENFSWTVDDFSFKIV